MKINFSKTSTIAISAGFDYSRLDLSALLGENKVVFNAISPNVSVSTYVGTSTSLHISGKYSYFSADEDKDFKPGSSTSGTSVDAVIKCNVSHKTKFLADAGYDITSKGIRLGGLYFSDGNNFG